MHFHLLTTRCHRLAWRRELCPLTVPGAWVLWVQKLLYIPRWCGNRLNVTEWSENHLAASSGTRSHNYNATAVTVAKIYFMSNKRICFIIIQMSFSSFSFHFISDEMTYKNVNSLQINSRSFPYVFFHPSSADAAGTDCFCMSETEME